MLEDISTGLHVQMLEDISTGLHVQMLEDISTGLHVQCSEKIHTQKFEHRQCTACKSSALNVVYSDCLHLISDYPASTTPTKPSRCAVM